MYIPKKTQKFTTCNHRFGPRNTRVGFDQLCPKISLDNCREGEREREIHLGCWFVRLEQMRLITSYLRDCVKFGEVSGATISSCVGRWKLRGLSKRSVISFLELKNYEFLRLKVGPSTLPMSRFCLRRSFLLTIALKMRTCVMALLVPPQLKFNSTLVDTTLPYRLPVGS